MRTDPEIRRVLLPRLLAERPGALPVQEWGVVAKYGCLDAASLIVDVAMIGDLVEAWEVKSEADSLARLPVQVPLYSSLFDHCTLVTAPRHLKHARAQLPAWWGLVQVLSGGDLITERPAQPNPGPYSTTGLLWSSELATIAKRLGVWKQALAACRAEYDAFRAARIATLPPEEQERHRERARRDRPKSLSRGELEKALAAQPAEVTAPLAAAALRARTDWRAPDGTHTRREARREIRQREAERQRQRAEDHARFLATYGGRGGA